MKKRWFSLILVILWMIVIFNFSNQTGTNSQGISMGVLRTLLSNFNLDENTIDLLHYLLRKGAHVGSYFILTLLTYYHLTCYEIKATLRYLLTCFIPVLYACSDEIHQTLIPDRSGKLMDVGVDSIGIGIALLVIVIVKKRLKVSK